MRLSSEFRAKKRPCSASGDDRFISNRSAMNYEVSNFEVMRGTGLTDAENADVNASPACKDNDMKTPLQLAVGTDPRWPPALPAELRHQATTPRGQDRKRGGRSRAATLASAPAVCSA